MTSQVTRVTMIKLSKEEHIAIALQGFETFTKNQEKDGAPYIISMQAGSANGHVREQGYTFVTKSVFKNMTDMKYYETECGAHGEYKAYLQENAPVEGLMTVYFTPGVTFEI